MNERGQQMFDADGRLRYRCGFRIGGGIDQDPSVSPQGYPDKALYLLLYNVIWCSDLFEDNDAATA